MGQILRTSRHQKAGGVAAGPCCVGVYCRPWRKRRSGREAAHLQAIGATLWKDPGIDAVRDPGSTISEQARDEQPPPRPVDSRGEVVPEQLRPTWLGTPLEPVLYSRSALGRRTSESLSNLLTSSFSSSLGRAEYPDPRPDRSSPLPRPKDPCSARPLGKSSARASTMGGSSLAPVRGYSWLAPHPMDAASIS